LTELWKDDEVTMGFAVIVGIVVGGLAAWGITSIVWSLWIK